MVSAPSSASDSTLNSALAYANTTWALGPVGGGAGVVTSTELAWTGLLLKPTAWSQGARYPGVGMLTGSPSTSALRKSPRASTGSSLTNRKLLRFGATP